MLRFPSGLSMPGPIEAMLLLDTGHRRPHPIRAIHARPN